MVLEEVVVQQPRRQRLDEDLVVLPEQMKISLFCHQDFPSQQLLAMKRPDVLKSTGEP